MPQGKSLNASADPNVIAAVTVVGTEALFGDVTVGAAVITPAIDSMIKIEESCNDDGQSQIDLWTQDASQRLASFSPSYSLDRSFLLFRPVGRTTPHPTVQRKLFALISQMADFSLISGFVPETSQDLVSKVDAAIDRLSAAVLYRFPEATLSVFGDHAAELPHLWREMLKSKNIFPHVGVTVEDKGVTSIAQAARLQVAAFASEFLATGVRTARVRDLAEIYPNVDLENNLGYPTDRSGMMGAVAPMVRSLNSGRGIRTGMLKQWIEWASSNPDVETAESDDEDDSRSRTFRSRKPYKDAQGRDCIKFDPSRAKQISDKLFSELNTSASSRWTDWKRQFVQSIHDQLESGRRLSDRQMYCLERIDT